MWLPWSVQACRLREAGEEVGSFNKHETKTRRRSQPYMGFNPGDDDSAV